jgi:hypothetical protein
MREDLKWRKCHAGHRFPCDAIVIPIGVPNDVDPRLVRCAIYDSHYILIDDLKKLPYEMD